MVRIFKRMILEKYRIWVKILCFRPISPSMFDGCRIELCIKWFEFQRDRLEKIWGFTSKYYVIDAFLLVCLVEVCSSTCVHRLIGFAWCKIEFYVQHNQLESHQRSKKKFLQQMLGKQPEKHTIVTQTTIFSNMNPSKLWPFNEKLISTSNKSN